MRDWVEMNLNCSKSTDAWTEIWDRAAQIDFAVAQCRIDQELMSKLAMDDTLEMHLRRLAFIKFRMRTGDKLAAAKCWRFMRRVPPQTFLPAGWWRMSPNTARRSINAWSVCRRRRIMWLAEAEIPQEAKGEAPKVEVSTLLTQTTPEVAVLWVACLHPRNTSTMSAKSFHLPGSVQRRGSKASLLDGL